jgi:hypothetical protein
MKALGIGAALALGLAACGGGGALHPSPDGATSDGAAPDGAAPDGAGGASTLAFDVTLTIAQLTASADDGAAFDQFPRTFHTTMVWDAAGGTVTLDDGTVASAGRLNPLAGGAYEISSSFTTNVPFASACGGMATLTLDNNPQVTLDGEGMLHGTSHGTASYLVSGAGLEAPAEVDIVGTPDMTAPSVQAPDGPVDPLATLYLLPSEALPPSATASLVGIASGDTVPLEAVPVGSGSAAIVGLRLATPSLRYSETYRLVADGLADYLGHGLEAFPVLQTQAAPPLVAQDGFESVTGTMFAGAGVLRGGPLTPITGETSLLLNTGFGGGFGFLPYDLGPSLAVRLTVAPGARTLRFDSQLISPDPVDEAMFVGAIRVGAVGHAVSDFPNIADTNFQKVTLPGLGDIYTAPVRAQQYDLPAGIDGEVTFEILGVTFSCDRPPSPTVLVIDNLRVE